MHCRDCRYKLPPWLISWWQIPSNSLSLLANIFSKLSSIEGLIYLKTFCTLSLFGVGVYNYYCQLCVCDCSQTVKKKEEEAMVGWQSDYLLWETTGTGRSVVHLSEPHSARDVRMPPQKKLSFGKVPWSMFGKP